MMKLIEYALKTLGRDIIITDKKHKATFKVFSKQCKFREETTIGPKRRVTFKCTNPNLEDPTYGWRCTMGNCPFLNGAMSWRANNVK